MDLIALLTGRPVAAGATELFDRLERKLDVQSEHLVAVRSDVAVLKGKGDDLGRVETIVGENARQIATLTVSVASLAKSMEGLEARLDRGEGQIAELRRLGDDVKILQATDDKVGKDLEGMKRTINRWGGGLIVAGVVGGAVWGVLGVKLTADTAPASSQVYVMPQPASAPATQPEPRRRR